MAGLTASISPISRGQGATLNNVEIRWHPTFELWLSCYTLKNRGVHTTLDLGVDWAREVQKQITPGLRRRIEKGRDNADVILPLMWDYAGKPTIVDFLRWMEQLSAGDLYELLQPWMTESRPAARLSILSDLGGERDELLAMLTEWNEQYFSQCDPQILDKLQEQTMLYRQFAKKHTPVEVVDQATGIDYSRVQDVATVFLVPQYHAYPWNIYEPVKPGVFYLFPVDALPVEPGQPPAALTRMAKALSDEARLRILRYLASGPKRFVEIMDYLGLPKSSTHNHIVLLRAARLIRLACEGGVDVYALRPGALGDISAEVSKYVEGDESPQPVHATEGSHR